LQQLATAALVTQAATVALVALVVLVAQAESDVFPHWALLTVTAELAQQVAQAATT
jgi:hypothetical protein